MGKAHPKKSGSRARAQRRPPAPDGAVYIGLLMIGAFGIGLWSVVSPTTWRHGLMGYFIALAFLLNLYTWQVLRGRHLAGWQQSLARLPLRWVGYGTRKGRPLEAAKGSPRARTMLIVSVGLSAVVIALLGMVLIP